MTCVQFASADDAPDLLVKTFVVKVSCETPEHVQGLPLRVFRVNGNTLAPVKNEAKFEDDGKATVQLPAGQYRFEALGSANIRFVTALHSAAVDVKDDSTVVKLTSKDFGEVTAGVDKTDLIVWQFGVRSIGPEGESAEESGLTAKIHFIGQPDETYACRFTAKNEDETLVVMGWESFKAAGNIKVIARKAQYNTVIIGPKKEMPFSCTMSVLMHFPSSIAEMEANGKNVLLTNRDFLLMSYKLRSKDDETLQFHPILYPLQKNTKLELGGKLTVSGWADAVLTKEKDGEGNRIFWVVAMTDPAGHVVDAENSSMHVVTEASLDNADWSSVSPYQGVDTGKLTNIQNRLRLRLTSEIPGFTEVAVKPMPFVKVSSSKFTLTVPGAWLFRGKNYLAKLERMNAASKIATGRPGPAQVNINWRINFSDAWALVGSKQGGERGFWMSMPVKGLDVDDPFAEPWAMTHEMMHNFGYGHGKEMNAMIDRAVYLFNLARWQAWDNRAYKL